MKRIALTIVIILTVVVAVGILSLSIQSYKINQTEQFFHSNDGFKARLDLAMHGSVNDRMRYYAIPDEYLLDGEYSESYYEGLEKLISIKGRSVIGNEITGDRNARFFAQISSQSSK